MVAPRIKHDVATEHDFFKDAGVGKRRRPQVRWIRILVQTVSNMLLPFAHTFEVLRT